MQNRMRIPRGLHYYVRTDRRASTIFTQHQSIRASIPRKEGLDCYDQARAIMAIMAIIIVAPWRAITKPQGICVDPWEVPG